MRIILATLVMLSHAVPVHAQEVAEGQKAFRVCGGCHTDVKGHNGFGPSLYGVVGRPAGSLPDYRYSDAMRRSGIVWDDAALDAFIAAPRDTVRGTKMPYGGMKDAVKRAAVIAYLKGLGD